MSAAPKNAPPVQKPPRWQGNEQALRAVQVAFDVEEAVMEAIRVAAFHGNVSTSTQIRQVLGLPAQGTVIALMPGSRRAEVEHLAPTFLAAA